MELNDYGQGSESDDALIYYKAWVYRQKNQEFQNLNNGNTDRLTTPVCG